MKSQKVSKSKIRNILILIFLILIACTKTYRKEKYVIEPANIALIDESTIDNVKVRHIFKEFLLKEIIDQNKKWLTVFDLDTLGRDKVDPEYFQYVVSFDIMQHNTVDIEIAIEKMLVSVKIINTQTGNILNSFIESAKGKGTELVSSELSGAFAPALVNKLSSYQKVKYEVPDVLSEPEDSLQVEEPPDTAKVKQ